MKRMIPDRVWDRLQRFALSGAEDFSREEVQAELAECGIDTRAAAERVKQAVAKERAERATEVLPAGA